jgi:hypothetical protein
MNTESLNSIQQRSIKMLERYERIKNLHDDLYTELILENGINLEAETEILMSRVVEKYDEQTNEMKTVTKGIYQIENWYITLDTRISTIIDNRLLAKLKKHGFQFNYVMNMADKNKLLIHLEDIDKENEKK